jgi:hypothetical protein
LASSSSLSALAAPSGDRPDDSSSVSLRSDDTTAHPNSTHTDSVSAFFSDTVTDHLQGRGTVNDALAPVVKVIEGVLGSLPKTRAENSPLSLVGDVVQGATGQHPPIQMATRAEESGADSPSQDESASQAPPASAGPGNGVKPPPAAPVDKLPLPIPALPSPQIPALPVKAPGRRDLAEPVGDIVSGVLNPPH